MSVLNQSGPGPEVKNQIGTVPAASAAGAINGTGVDRRGFNFAILEAQTGAVTGAPTAQTLDAKIQHSDTVGGTYADFVPGAAGSGAVAQITAINSRKRKQIDLRGAKAFVRVVTTVGLTAGTAPTLAHCVTLQLAGADVLPAQSDD